MKPVPSRKAADVAVAAAGMVAAVVVVVAAVATNPTRLHLAVNSRAPARTLVPGPVSLRQVPSWISILTVLVHTHLLAHLQHRTGRATRQQAPAHVFAEWHKQPVDLHAKAARQLG